MTIASVVRPMTGCANVRKRKPSEMKLSAMPASVERSAARGVAFRTRSATNAAASSMTPGHERREEARLPCDERRVGRARALGERLGGQHDQEDVGEERDGVDAIGQRADVVAAGPLGEPPRLDRVGDVADEDGDRRGRQHASVDELGRKARARHGTRCRLGEVERGCRGQGRRTRRRRRERSNARAEHSRRSACGPSASGVGPREQREMQTGDSRQERGRKGPVSPFTRAAPFRGVF